MQKCISVHVYHAESARKQWGSHVTLESCVLSMEFASLSPFCCLQFGVGFQILGNFVNPCLRSTLLYFGIYFFYLFTAVGFPPGGSGQ